MTGLETRVKKLGLSAGFDLVGITGAEPFLRDEEAAVERVRAGLMDGLDWYTEDRVRLANRPAELLAGARSVVSLAVSYNTRKRGGDGRITGRVARYAWGEDYHKVIKRRLKEFVEGLPEVVGRFSVRRDSRRLASPWRSGIVFSMMSAGMPFLPKATANSS